MELKITESQKNFMDANKNTSTPNKVPINYDDILSKMSMCVVDGKLQFFNKQLENVNTNDKIMSQKNNTKKVKFNANNANYQNNNTNQSDNNITDNASVPIKLTELQYKQLAFLNQMKRQQEINRLNELKPKKLLFSMNDIKIKSTVNPNMNKLFRFVGK